ncbi:glycosyltransferase [Spirosoma sp. KCTC 42546]|uniref:glycosyltransferase family 2 protein n=1 Tax=Spirosoma sp. KCTC 42546 TaxID=2520506 RepID=UPI00115B58C2|nr:glycosyltransferase family 2 protein [Spirosoma sp. KCTC 42546]QDK79726.1 glycosyltransferase [Spirosoma sp. KCTC 42546]
MNAISCSVLVATYNRPAALELCLVSLFEQRQLPTEIIVCDDGSSIQTGQLIERLKQLSPVPLLHVWQPDEGFRLARIRNLGFAMAKGAYIIQLDGDVILHPLFVQDHLYHAQPSYFFSGNQFKLSADSTQQLLTEPSLSLNALLRQSHWHWSSLRVLTLQKFIARFYHWGTHYKYVLGCNMGFWRQDLVRVNGYDEQFLGWGWEDTELALRLINRGINLRFIRLGAIQYHLYHPTASRGQEDINRARAMHTLHQKLTGCQKGLQQHLQQLESPLSNEAELG